jgi:hypothetical protein
MGSNSSSGGSGNNNSEKKESPKKKSANKTPSSRPTMANVAGPTKKTYATPRTLSDPREKNDTAAKMSLFREQGATNLKNKKIFTPGAAILSGVGQATSRYNRDYFANEVLGKGAYKGTTKQDFEKMSRTSQESLYSGYMSGRQSGKTDAYGRDINKTDRGGNSGGAIRTSGQVVQAPTVTAPTVTAPTVTAPTTAEVSQSAATDAAEDNILLRKRRTKSRGRSTTIVTGSTGATGSLTLGIPSLLGR